KSPRTARAAAPTASPASPAAAAAPPRPATPPTRTARRARSPRMRRSRPCATSCPAARTEPAACRSGPYGPLRTTNLAGVRALRVGLTGGIGAGKSEVSRRLASYGALVIDADQIAREVVEPGTPGLAQVVGLFGTGVLATGGTLDRQRLGEIV